MRNFISAHDAGNIDDLVAKALAYKAHPLMHKTLGTNKRVGMLFLNPSLRTRLSTQVAAANLGMEALVFNVDKEGWRMEFEVGIVMNGNTVEHIKDAAPVLGAYFDVLCIRTFPSLTDKHADQSEMIINQFIRYAGVPVVSMESATLHPLQSFTDIITIKELFTAQRKPRIVLTWTPHIKPIPHCVANSFAQWVNMWGGAELVITHPQGYELDEQFTAGATIEYDQQRALQGADFVYAKNWSSYSNYGQVLCADESWMLTQRHMSVTNNARLMHCLPARRNVEVADEVLDGDGSIVTNQAANRVWAAQTVLSEIITTNR